MSWQKHISVYFAVVYSYFVYLLLFTTTPDARPSPCRSQIPPCFFTNFLRVFIKLQRCVFFWLIVQFKNLSFFNASIWNYFHRLKRFLFFDLQVSVNKCVIILVRIGMTSYWFWRIFQGIKFFFWSMLRRIVVAGCKGGQW